MRRNGFAEAWNPILKPLGTIECRDAIPTADDTESEWPETDVVIVNPPFMGGKLLITHLGEDYVSRMFATYAGRVPASLRRIPFEAARTVGLWKRRTTPGGSSTVVETIEAEARRHGQM